MGRIRMDWCDLYFHAIDKSTESIVPVIDILTVIDSQYDFLKVSASHTSNETLTILLITHSHSI